MIVPEFAAVGPACLLSERHHHGALALSTLPRPAAPSSSRHALVLSVVQEPTACVKPSCHYLNSIAR